jgi:aminocarboxymuconate-semialdehyde decarboxylase
MITRLEIKMIIDIFNHYISKRVGKMLVDEYNNVTYPKKNADPEIRLGLMEKYGIDMQALSMTTPLLDGKNAEEAAEMCMMANEDNYALCKAYPKNFVNICIISLLDMEKAMKELERSINELDCRAVIVASNQNGKGLDSPEFLPFYKKLAENDLPLLIHPAHWESYPLVDDATNNWWTMAIFGWPFDTTQAVWRLILGGVLDRFSTLKIIMHHCGGMLPYFAQRAEKEFTSAWETGLSPEIAKMPRHITEYWGNLYGDTALDGNTTGAYLCGYGFFGADRMLFGTDYPFCLEEGEDFIRSNLEGVKAMDIPEKELEKILGGNAQKLLKIIPD